MFNYKNNFIISTNKSSLLGDFLNNCLSSFFTFTFYQFKNKRRISSSVKIYQNNFLICLIIQVANIIIINLVKLK